MKKSTILLITSPLLAFVMACPAVAAPSDLNFVDQEIYQETLQSCSHFTLKNDHLTSFLVSAGQGLSIIKNSITGSAELEDEVQQLVQQQGVSPYLFDRLQSEGFMQAMRECFPNSETKRNLYVGSLILVDSAGRLPGAVALYLMGRASAKGFGAVFTYSRTAGYVAVGSTMLGTALSVYKSMKQKYDIVSEKVEADVASFNDLSTATVDLRLEMADSVITETIRALEIRLAAETQTEKRQEMIKDIETLKRMLNRKG